MNEPSPGRQSSKAERRAARAVVVTYHEAKMAELVEHVRGGIARYDAGEIDVLRCELIDRHATGRGASPRLRIAPPPSTTSLLAWPSPHSRQGRDPSHPAFLC
jgi:hypothetical protein